VRSIVLALILATVGVNVRAETYWIGEASSADWGNPDNWDNGLPDKSVNTYIQNFAPINWPVLDGGAAHSALLAIAYEPNMLSELTVTGGALLAVHRDVRIARRSPGGETGTLSEIRAHASSEART